MKRIPQTALVIASLLCPAGILAVRGADAPAPIVITVSPDKQLGAVNPLLFGNNLEAANGKDIFGPKASETPLNGQGTWDPVKRRPVPEILTIAKEIKLGMLRYPGGCLAHNFDWHQAVGAPETRTYFKFGIDEYIELCRAMHAEPLFTMSEICTPKDAADLVEYLNLPAVPEHPWAMKRAAWGHKEPYQVKYFEMANESDHGNHNVKPHLRRTATEYANWYLACAEAMRKMDGSILIGGHAGTGTPVSDPWNATVLKLAGDKMDFFAIHTYAVNGHPVDTRTPMEACMASDDQLEAKLAAYRALIRKETGKNIPMAITEFNASFVQEKPVPFRYSFGAALFCADYMRILLKPETNVAFANYWQFLNGYWGYVRTSAKDGRTQVQTRAAYPVFKLLGQHSDSELIGCAVTNEPKLEFDGFATAKAAKGDSYSECVPTGDLPLPLCALKGKGYEVKTTGSNSLEVMLQDFNGSSFPAMTAFAIKPGLGYMISFEMKIETQKGSLTPGLGLCDERGWDATNSACGVEGSPVEEGWQKLSANMTSLTSAKKLQGVVRLLNGEDFSGSVKFRDIKVSECKPEKYPAYSALTAFATSSKDGKTVKLIVLNKHLDSDLTARIALRNAASAKLWTVSAPDMATTEHSPAGAFERVSGKAIEGIANDGFTLKFPARSISAIDIILK